MREGHGSESCIYNVYYIYSKTCLNQTPLGLKNLFSLDRFKLHRHLVDGTVKCVWFRQVFGLIRVWFRQVFGLIRVLFRQVSLYMIYLINTNGNKYDFERTWWRLFQKHVVCTKFNIYVFMKTMCISFYFYFRNLLGQLHQMLERHQINLQENSSNLHQRTDHQINQNIIKTRSGLTLILFLDLKTEKER